MGDGSLGYASRLSFREDLGGELGAPEVHDSTESTESKAIALAALIRQAKHVVCFTGAGISTSAGIPDFRGPEGVWTKQRRGEALPNASCPFEHARPSYTHQALLALQRSGKLQYLVSQNVDSLHLRSGFPRSSLAELHGNCFAERCETCGAEYVRDFEVCSVGFKRTGRRCTAGACRGMLRDHCLDWDDALPEDELQMAERHAAKADLCLCLGTSLVITPACDIPLRALSKRKHKPRGGSLAVVNLQPTPKDGKAKIVIHSKVDGVMRIVMRELGIQVPPYRRSDSLLVSHELNHSLSSAAAASSSTLHLTLASVHGADCPLPWLASCDVSFSKLPNSPTATIAGPPWSLSLPLDVHTLGLEPGATWEATLRLTYAAGTNAPPATLTYSFSPPEALGRRKHARSSRCRYDLTTCIQDFSSDPVPGAPPGAAAVPAAAAAGSSSDGTSPPNGDAQPTSCSVRERPLHSDRAHDGAQNGAPPLNQPASPTPCARGPRH